MFDNFVDIIFGVGFVLFIQLEKHLLKLVKAYELMSAVELIDTGETTEPTRFAFFVQTNHQDFLVVALPKSAKALYVCISDHI